MDILGQIECFLLDCRAELGPILQKTYTEFTETSLNFNAEAEQAQFEFEDDIDTFKYEKTDVNFIFKQCEEFKEKSLRIASKVINKEINKINKKFKTDATNLRALVNGTLNEIKEFQKDTKENINYILDSKSMSPTEMGLKLTQHYEPAMEIFERMKEEFKPRAKEILEIQESTSRDIDTAFNTLSNKCKMKYDDIADVYKKCCNAAIELFLEDFTGNEFLQIY